MIDVKGDLPNLLLSFPTLDAETVGPWLGESDGAAAAFASRKREKLSAWGIGDEELRRFHESTSVRVLTPGATSGEPLHLLSALERRSGRCDSDPESARRPERRCLARAASRRAGPGPGAQQGTRAAERARGAQAPGG
ncbi:MAG: hypothetical protein MUF54_21055 [Polyangiaceae bacterium]|nr:hypothetical protein [Polyangiaceae bacterium]